MGGGPLQSRIDALGDDDDDERLAALTGELLSRELDGQLQSCVERAAKDIAAPMAMVSLVLAKTQFFRAHYGLPPELAVARAADRSTSFCQFVVRDGDPFEVADATADERVPQDLVECFGVRAYLGVPLLANHTVVGSMCVIDTRAREFSDDERATLVALAKVASERLQVLAKLTTRPRDELLKQAVAPAFGEIRNLLVPLTIGACHARVAVAELHPLVALSRATLSPEQVARAMSVLRDAAKAIRDLESLHEDIEISLGRIKTAFDAIERVTVNPETWAPVTSVVRSGLELARHMTKLAGGVEIGTYDLSLRLSCPMATAASLVSAAASHIAAQVVDRRATGPLAVRVAHDDTRVIISVGGPALSSAIYSALADELRGFLGDMPDTTVVGTGGVSISFARAR